MSLLDQAKKEAKRLFNLAKANQESNPTNAIQLDIPKLSAAREVVAVINGYKNWHEYEEVLKRKDLVFNMVDKNTENKQVKYILSNKKYFIQDIGFNWIDNPHHFKKDTTIIMKQDHKPITLGHIRIRDKPFFDKNVKHWELNQYPLLVTGSTGAGKTEILLSLGVQYIKNDEGLIYIDGKGESALYAKIFSYAQENKKLHDLYCLNFMNMHNYLDEFGIDDQTKENLSHSIDPINPMVGNDKYFNLLFGTEIGNLVHSILKKIHENGQLMDIQSLESIFMLNNLIQWSRDETFGKMIEINNYIVSLGLSLDQENDESDFEDALEKHAIKCMKAYETMILLKSYSSIFRIDCSIDMTQIFLKRKVLVVLLPALEKSRDEICLLGEMITAQIAHVQNTIGLDTHLQNIIMDEFLYYAKNIPDCYLSTTKNNYIFGSHDHGYTNSEDFAYVMTHSKTYVAMKMEDSQFCQTFKLQLIDNLSDAPKNLFTFDNRFGTNKNYLQSLRLNLNDQREGEAVVFCLNYHIDKSDSLLINNEHKYYTQKLTCVYIPCPKPKAIWLVDHPIPIIYTKV